MKKKKKGSREHVTKLSFLGQSETQACCDGFARQCIKNILIFRAEVKSAVASVRIAINGDRCGMHNAYRLQLRAYLRKKLICVLAYPAIDFGHEFGNRDNPRNKNKLDGLTYVDR